MLIACSALPALSAIASHVSAQEKDMTQVQTALDTAAQAIQDDRPGDALMALKSADAIERDNPWVWFYRGVAHLKLGDWYESLEGFDRAQDLLTTYGNPEPMLSQRIADYRAQARKQVFGISYQVGIVYDSNVTFFGSGGAGFEISGRGDAKFLSRLQIAYSPIAGRDESFTIGVRVADAWHFSIEDFNDQDYGATLRYAHRIGERWEAALQYDYDVLLLGNKLFSSNHALSPSLTYEWSQSATPFRPAATTLFYRLESSDYLFDTDWVFDRDGFTNRVGVDQKFAIQPIPQNDWTCDLNAGYALGYVATDGSEFDRRDHDFHLGLTLPLANPWLPDRKLTMRLNAAWQIGDYRHHSAIDRLKDPRDDVIMSYNATVSQELVKNPELGDVILHLIVGWSDAESNVITSDRGHPFSYDKWVAGFQLEWSW